MPQAAKPPKRAFQMIRQTSQQEVSLAQVLQATAWSRSRGQRSPAHSEQWLAAPPAWTVPWLSGTLQPQRNHGWPSAATLPATLPCSRRQDSQPQQGKPGRRQTGSSAAGAVPVAQLATRETALRSSLTRKARGQAASAEGASGHADLDAASQAGRGIEGSDGTLEEGSRAVAGHLSAASNVEDGGLDVEDRAPLSIARLGSTSGAVTTQTDEQTVSQDSGSEDDAAAAERSSSVSSASEQPEGLMRSVDSMATRQTGAHAQTQSAGKSSAGQQVFDTEADEGVETEPYPESDEDADSHAEAGGAEDSTGDSEQSATADSGAAETSDNERPIELPSVSIGAAGDAAASGEVSKEADSDETVDTES